MRLITLRLKPTASPNPNFFHPSYRNLSRPQVVTPTSSPSACRSFSVTSGGSSSRAGGVGGSRGNGRLKQQSPAATSAAPSSNLSSSKATPPSPPSSTPSAPLIPHASFGLIKVDAFFATHRPLLELPIRLSARKTVAAPVTRYVSSDMLMGENQEGMESVDGEELVEMVDIAPDGTPLGPSYITTISASKAAEPARTAEEVEELKDLEEEATEAALRDIEAGLSNPYEAWLIAERAPHSHSPAVSRYLASHPPFQLPAVPSSTVAPKSTEPSFDSAPTLTPKALSDLTFLRPFPSTVADSEKSAPASASALTFVTQFMSPLPPKVSSDYTSTFLTNALRAHTWKAATAYELAATSLESARRSYAGIEGKRVGLTERRKKGEVRVWESEGGWKTVALGKEADSFFLPAEMVDLDWEDEEIERKMVRRVQMDSTKRKRKKKITKHKYKKRRKAQKAMRQRLGK